MNHKLPTYDKMMERGCSMPSLCNLGSKNMETAFHIFFTCPYPIKVWYCWT